MARTRSQKRKQKNDNSNDLQSQINLLTKEHEALVNQLNLLCQEYDELKNSVSGKKEIPKKVKRTHNHSHAVNANDEDHELENRATCSLIEALYPSLTHSTYHADLNKINTVPEKCPIQPKPPQSPKMILSKPCERPKTSQRPQKIKTYTKLSKTSEKPRVILIGTSMVKDIYLRQSGLNGITYCYPGQTVPFITSRIKHILEGETADFVILQCGGNDLVNSPNHVTILEYKTLVDTVRAFAPNANIIIGKVPPRGVDSHFNNRINMFNTFLKNLAQRSSQMEFFTVVPFKFSQFKTDLIHFNNSGSTSYTSKLVELITYHQSFPKPTVLRLI